MRSSTRQADVRLDPSRFVSAVRAVSKRADALGKEAMLLDVAPATAMALPTVIVVFAAESDAMSLAMVERVSAAAAACARSHGSAPPIAVMDAASARAAELARRLGVEMRGRGEACWLANGAAVGQTDAFGDDASLRELTITLARAAPA
jgi:hypothetical protein